MPQPQQRSVAEVVAEYSDQASWLTLYAGQQADGLLLVSPTTWDTQQDGLGADIDPVSDPGALVGVFSRARVDLLYEQAMLEAGALVGDLIGLTLQGDQLSMMERAYRARHTGRIRRQAHSAARLSGHGDTQGKGVHARTRGHVQDVIAAASLGLVDVSGDTFDVEETARQENKAMDRT